MPIAEVCHQDDLRGYEMNKLFSYIKPHVPIMSLGLFIKLIGTVMDLFIPRILAYIIDDLAPQKNIFICIKWGAVMILCALVAAVGSIVANRMASKVSKNITTKLRGDLFEKTLRLSHRQADGFTLPSLVSRLTSDTYHVHAMVIRMQRIGVRAPILLLGGILMTFTLDWALALILLGLLPLIMGVVAWVSRKGIPLFEKTQGATDDVVQVARENITGIRVIKALSKEEKEAERFLQKNEALKMNESKAAQKMALTKPMMNFLLNIGLVLVLLVGAFRVHQGLSKPGTIIAFLTYFTIILNAMISITRVFVIYAKGKASYGRIKAVLDEEDDLVQMDLPPLKTPYHIVFKDVSFSYFKQKNSLAHVSFGLKKGQTLGLIGGTGSGKSTLIALMMRFYDPDGGHIYIDGINLKNMSKKERQQKFGVVFQKDVLFADSIYENVSFGRDMKREDILAALSFARASEFVDGDLEGMDKMIAIRGGNLSGGQKQRLFISRAVAQKPEILILDDAASALDYKTDAELRKNIAQKLPGTTKIIVAQRISSIRHADWILVLDEGNVVGQGRHESLLKTCEIYGQMAQIQGEGKDADEGQ